MKCVYVFKGACEWIEIMYEVNYEKYEEVNGKYRKNSKYQPRYVIIRFPCVPGPTPITRTYTL